MGESNYPPPPKYGDNNQPENNQPTPTTPTTTTIVIHQPGFVMSPFLTKYPQMIQWLANNC